MMNLMTQFYNSINAFVFVWYEDSVLSLICNEKYKQKDSWQLKALMRGFITDYQLILGDLHKM